MTSLEALHARAKALHPEDVRRLAHNIFFPHVHIAAHPKECRRGCCRHPVLARPGFCDDAFFAQEAG